MSAARGRALLVNPRITSRRLARMPVTPLALHPHVPAPLLALHRRLQGVVPS
jgi:hypothetical protein